MSYRKWSAMSLNSYICRSAAVQRVFFFFFMGGLLHTVVPHTAFYCRWELWGSGAGRTRWGILLSEESSLNEILSPGANRRWHHALFLAFEEHSGAKRYPLARTSCTVGKKPLVVAKQPALRSQVQLAKGLGIKSTADRFQPVWQQRETWVSI